MGVVAAHLHQGDRPLRAERMRRTSLMLALLLAVNGAHAGTAATDTASPLPIPAVSSWGLLYAPVLVLGAGLVLSRLLWTPSDDRA